MDRALTNAIYYSDTIHGKVVTEYEYSNKDDFIKIVKNLRNDIKVRNIFGTSDSICYKICDFISSSYDNLLMGKIDSLLVITRRDNAIRFIRSEGTNVGIIKIDSVISELDPSPNYSYLLLLPIILLAWKFNDSFPKSDSFLYFFKS